MKTLLSSIKKLASRRDPIPHEELREYITYLASPRRIFWINFLAGTGRGLGFVIGTVIVLTLIAFIVHDILAQIPWVGEIFRVIDGWLRENIASYQPQ